MYEIIPLKLQIGALTAANRSPQPFGHHVAHTSLQRHGEINIRNISGWLWLGNHKVRLTNSFSRGPNSPLGHARLLGLAEPICVIAATCIVRQRFTSRLEIRAAAHSSATPFDGGYRHNARLQLSGESSRFQNELLSATHDRWWKREGDENAVEATGPDI